MREPSLRRRRRGEIYAQVRPKLFIIARWGDACTCVAQGLDEGSLFDKNFLGTHKIEFKYSIFESFEDNAAQE